MRKVSVSCLADEHFLPFVALTYLICSDEEYKVQCYIESTLLQFCTKMWGKSTPLSPGDLPLSFTSSAISKVYQSRKM